MKKVMNLEIVATVRERERESYSLNNKKIGGEF